ncbi:MAG TPA: hypothetical protein VHN81_11795 [Edaphobacter sp.]|nr:hypothetical protein [Edaphobacter sp.]
MKRSLPAACLSLAALSLLCPVWPLYAADAAPSKQANTVLLDAMTQELHRAMTS